MDVVLKLSDDDTSKAWELLENYNNKYNESETLAEYLEAILGLAIMSEHRKLREGKQNELYTRLH